MSPKVGDAEICPCGKEIVAGQLHDGIRAVPPAFECIDPPDDIRRRPLLFPRPLSPGKPGFLTAGGPRMREITPAAARVM